MSNKDEKQKEEEFEDFLKALDEIEKANKSNKDNKGKKPRNLIAIEFGGVFHRNIYVNMIFNFVLNFMVFYIVIETFSFATFKDIYYLAAVVIAYTVVEQLFKAYVLLHFFNFVLKSLGFVFYFGYVFIFYILDAYVFLDSFDFVNETLLVVSVAMFTIIRYFISTAIRKRLRFKR